MEIKKKIKYLILAIILISVVIPNSALAVLLPVVDPVVAGILMGQEAAAPVFKVLVHIFLIYIIGLVTLYTSAHLLQYVIEHPEWLSVTHNDMVQTGWQFTSGLANLFIVLALIIIAFGFILKIESWQSKKALPRLLIVALLVNFSLVFVGALIDIANILFNTILTSAGNDLPLKVIETLGASGWGIVLSLGAWIIALAVSFLIPLLGGAAKMMFLTLFFAVAFVPSIITWVFQISLFFLVGGMFFLYAFLFAVRVYIIQLLAILSPIFFLCWALPPLKKYWDEWFGHLMEWLLFGVILFFFLVIGLKATNYLMPESRIPPSFPFLGWLSIKDYFSYYFFLFVYLAVVAGWVTMRVMPQIAKVLIEQGTKFGTQLWAMGAKPFGKAVGQEFVREAGILEKTIAKKEAEGELGRLEQVGKKFAGVVDWTLRQTTGTTLAEQESMRSERAAEKIAQMKDLKDAVVKIKQAAERGDEETAGRATAKMVVRGGDAKDAILGGTTSEEGIKWAAELKRKGFTEHATVITAANLHKIEEVEAKAEALKKVGFKSYDQLSETKQKEWESKGFITKEEIEKGDYTNSTVRAFMSEYLDPKHTAGAFWKKKDETTGEMVIDEEMMEILSSNAVSPGQIMGLASIYPDFRSERKKFLKERFKTWEKFKEFNESQAINIMSSLAQGLGVGPPDSWLAKEKISPELAELEKEIEKVKRELEKEKDKERPESGLFADPKRIKKLTEEIKELEKKLREEEKET